MVVDQNLAVARGDLLGCDASLINFVGVVIAGLKFTVRIGRVCAQGRPAVRIPSRRSRAYNPVVGEQMFTRRESLPDAPLPCLRRAVSRRSTSMEKAKS